jgi:peptidoglycan/xylan/chitin deacetylase (PgdA/CDA1 family)
VNKLAAVSVDLDEIDCYAAIHGLADARAEHGESFHAVYDRALPRLLRLFTELDIPATFFAIGRDVARAANPSGLRALAAQGHEIANHSLSHFYDLTRRSREVMEREVSGGADAIAGAVGERPVGFRAPGYTMNDALFEVLARVGVLYDSSVFPCPSYYALKASALGWIRLRGRQSRSVLDHPRVLTAPADPYRIGQPYARRGSGLVELPIGVTSDLSGRLPYIGTSVVMAGAKGARALTRLAASRPLVNLELHGIDLADAHDDGLAWLAPHQPDLRVSAAQKELALRAAVQELRARGFTFVTLREAARRA